jgi:mono/diheme cytochrome c family protein
MMKKALTILSLGLIALNAAAATPEAVPAKGATTKLDPKLVERGRYLVKIAGCNDCHTPSYMASAGKVPEAQWLTGDKLGWRGPWGTTYAVNLRLYMRDLPEAEWVKRAKTMETRPPMPWFALRDMTNGDLKAIYQYVKSQPVTGEPAPAYVPPGQEPKTPFAQFPAPTK